MICMPSETDGPLIHLRIESTTGGVVEREFNPNQPVRAVKVAAMGALNLDPSTEGNYRLLLEGNQLPEDKTLEEAGVPDGATLVLAPIRAEVI